MRPDGREDVTAAAAARPTTPPRGFLPAFCSLSLAFKASAAKPRCPIDKGPGEGATGPVDRGRTPFTLAPICRVVNAHDWAATGFKRCSNKRERTLKVGWPRGRGPEKQETTVRWPVGRGAYMARLLDDLRLIAYKAGALSGPMPIWLAV